MKDKKYFGLGVSSGIAIAPVYVYQKKKIVIDQSIVDDVQEEEDAFWRAHQRVCAETQELKEKLSTQLSEKDAEILGAHLMILDDNELTDPIVNKIRSGYNAQYAVAEGMKPIIKAFAEMEDSYMKERGADMRDIADRLIRTIIGEAEEAVIKERSIIVAHDLAPSDTAKLDCSKVAGIITETGGPTSHTAIMARSLGIPAIVGCENILCMVRNGMLLALDGMSGAIELKPTAERQKELEKVIVERYCCEVELSKYKDRASETADGHCIEIAVNVGSLAEVQKACQSGAESIGLFRSEFLYMERVSLPSQEEQFLVYKSAAEAFCGKTVIVRTLDVGGDKKIPAMELPEEENPFLGFRAIRVCLEKKEIFRAQLKALLRAGAFGGIQIMLPMISSLEELRETKQVIEACKTELRMDKIPFNDAIKVGIMIEIPAAAVMANELAQECDFFSIGTNDLIQYTAAVDRGNERVMRLYSPYHPAVLRLIHYVIQAAHRHGKPCGMCGEAASDSHLIPVLLGMGLDELSMSACAITASRKQITELSFGACKKLTEEVLTASTTQQVKKILGASS